MLELPLSRYEGGVAAANLDYDRENSWTVRVMKKFAMSKPKGG